MSKYLKFPLKINTNNNLEMYTSDYDFYDQNIKLFFRTNKGSKIWDKRKGCSIRQFLGRPLTTSFQSIVNDSVTNELKRAFPRLKINNVSVSQIDENHNSFVININYNFKKEINSSVSRSISVTIR